MCTGSMLSPRYSHVHFRTNEWSLRLFLYYTGSVDAHRKHVKSALQAGSFSHRSMSGASSYFYTTLDQRMHAGSMLLLSRHYSLVHFQCFTWGNGWNLRLFLYYIGSVDARRKHVKSALQPCSLSYWSVSEASGYFYTTLDQWMHTGSMLSPHYSLVHFHTGQWVEPQVIFILITARDQWMHAGSMLSSLQPCSLSHQWVESQVIFILCWISGCMQEAC